MYRGYQQALSSQMKTDWWKGAVIYQIYPRSFHDSNGDGIGDLRGITSKLQYIADLGVDAIWISPFYLSPMADFGYDVQDYKKVDPIFGTLDDFDELITKAHSLGLKVITDQVWCHTSNQHDWFIESRSSQRNDKSDWYVWADPQPDGTAPNNWLSVFGGSAWTWEPRRRQFYLHHFLSSQPKLNLRNPRVVDALMDAGRFWLERGVDGFRLDAIDFLMHDPLLRSNPVHVVPEVPLKLFGMQLHKYDMMHSDIHGFLQKIRQLTDQFPGTTTMGELSSQNGAFERVHHYTSGNDALHMAYTLKLMKGYFEAPTVKQTLDHVLSLGPEGWHCWSFNNHDVERAVTRWHEGKYQGAFARMLMALLLTMRGSICLYQGEELGLSEAELSHDELRDPFGITYYPHFKGRDGSRTPIPWDDGPNAGFTTGTPWLPVYEEHKASTVQRLDADATSLLHHYRKFLRFRKQHQEFINGPMQTVDLPEPLFGFTRGDLLAVFNTCPTWVTFDTEHTELDGSGFRVDRNGKTVTLPPFGVFLGTK